MKENMQITDNQSMFASFCPYNDSWISPVNGRRPNERHEEIVLSLVSGRPRVPRPAGRRIHSPNRPVIKPSIMVASFTRWLTKHCSTLNWPRFISLPILLPPPSSSYMSSPRVSWKVGKCLVIHIHISLWLIARRWTFVQQWLLIVKTRC